MGATSPTFNRSFAAGELSPALAMRADLARYQQGLRTCRNFIVLRSGGASNRSGTRYVNPCKTNLANVRIIPYVGDVVGTSMLIEAGNGYLRFYLDGGLVTVDISGVASWSNATAYVIGDLVKSGGNIYYATDDGTNNDPTSQPSAFWSPPFVDGIFEIPTPFGSSGLFNSSQSGRVITLTHPDVQPHELIFEDVDRWVFRPVTTLPVVQPPQSPVLTNTVGARSYGYVITAAHPVTYEESQPSAQVIDTSALAPTPDAPHLLSWTAVITDGDASPEYYVYCDPFGNGTYGYIGTATGQTAFKNPGTTPDFNLTPPIAEAKFVAAGEFPSISATYQQRRIFAATDDNPDAAYGSRVGLPSNYGISSPLQDDDALSFKIAGNNNHPIRSMVPLKTGLVLLTDGGVWTARGPEGQTLAPNAIDLEQETYVGAAVDVAPVVVGNGIVYLQARNSTVHTVRFDVQVEGLAGQDLTVAASHLFDAFAIRAMALQVVPNPIVWCVRDDGTLLSLTYVPEEGVAAWARHDTQSGIFYDVCIVPEAGEDAVYVITARDFGAGTQMSIERFASRTIRPDHVDEDGYFVDMGLSYSGAAVTSVSGLDHLDGQIVAVVADGVVVSDGDPAAPTPVRVIAGAVALPTAASNVHVGLPIRFAELETVDLDIAGAQIRDKKKRVQALRVVLYQSSRSFRAGRSPAATLTPYRPQSIDVVTKVFSGDVELNVVGTFDDNGRVFLRQTDPLPITVLGFVPQVELGG